MKIGAPKEIFDGENRVALTPESGRFLQKLGHECIVQSGAGLMARYSDQDYKDAGVKVVKSAASLWKETDVVIKVRAPNDAEVQKVSNGQVLISFVWPDQNKTLLEKLAAKGVTCLAMDMVPRISRAQKMDALSSMANIAGYRSVIEAGNNFGRFFTGQITAAGKVPPAKVLVIGAGVAGLAAIGTAQSMGAIVRAFDVRPEVSEQIESMGAEFLFLDFEEDASGDGGYAAPSSPEFREKQLECFRKQASDVDIVITTALIPGRDAPKLWLTDMVEVMKSGSVVVDLAAERGGNCDLTVPDKKIETNNGITIIGYTDFPSQMATQASTLYANNVGHMLDDLTPGKDGKVKINMKDDVIRGATVTHAKKVTFPPPAPKVNAIAKPSSNRQTGPSPEVAEKLESDKLKKSGQQQLFLLGAGGLLMALIGSYAPPSFMQHFIVFVLACFIGFQVIWNVSHALHTPLMAITNAISGIIILGALLQINTGSLLIELLAGVSILIATINIVGGFMVTRRMLSMFKKS